MLQQGGMDTRGGRRSFDAAERRRSMELARSSRRYDEYWGAAERADTRLKCKDGVIHHVHSQIISCWSPVLRDMVSQLPAHTLLESTHGLAYLLQLPEDSTTWAALLDMLYPSCPPPTSWDLLERVLVLANQYEMGGVLQRGVQHVVSSGAGLSLDPAADNYALRWLELADKLQLPQLAQYVTSWLQPQLPALAVHPTYAAAWLTYSSQNLNRDLVLHLLQATMAALRDIQQQQGQQQSLVHNTNANFSSRSGGNSWQQQRQQQQVRTNDWVMGGNGLATGPAAFGFGGGGDLQEASSPPSSSGEAPSTNSQGQGDDPAWMDSASSLAAPGSPEAPASPGTSARLALCMSSGLYATPEPPATSAAPAGAAAAMQPPAGFGAGAASSATKNNLLPSIPAFKRASQAPGLSSVMEVDNIAEALGMGGRACLPASRQLPGSRRRSLAY